MELTEYQIALGKLAETSPEVGEVLTVDRAGLHAAVVRICRHNRLRHVEIRIDGTNPPRRALLGLPQNRDPALKGYLLDQNYEGPVHKVVVERVYAKSCYVRVI